MKLAAQMLLGVLFCAALIPRVTGAAAASKLAEAERRVACPPHWMPVLQGVASKEVRTTSRVRLRDRVGLAL